MLLNRWASMAYDLIVVGGGMAGSTLARRMSAGGARVLVLEREAQFRDRVRGESLQPWGVAEAQQLGVAELLRPLWRNCAGSRRSSMAGTR
jgi:flavin-dependent dehydrogenase